MSHIIIPLLTLEIAWAFLCLTFGDDMIETTRDGMVAANMANRNFRELFEPVIDELKTKEAKRMYCKTLLSHLSAKLSHISTETFEDDMNEMIGVINESCLAK